MSHELRTPLNAILGFSAMVRTDPSLPDRHRQDLAVIGHSGEHLLDLIDDVLDMAKIETGSVIVENASFDLNALVYDAVDMIRERAQAKNLELRVEIASGTPRFVRSDPGKVRQVLANLVGNAVKYTEEGRVTVLVNSKLAENSRDSALILEVEDTGIGIAPEDQARIFDPFVQAGSTKTRVGAGLGLSISRRFVELLGGTIQVESTPRLGSRFRVEVPVETTKAPGAMLEDAAVEEVAGLEPGQPGYRILIVEDQRENRLLLERLLHEAGFQVRVAEDGSQAIEAFREWRPHFIWMDVRLPVLGGVEAAKRIRELEGGRGVKIVAVTASASASQREEVLAAGLDDFLRKPYRRGEIFECMARHLGVRYLYRASGQASADVSAGLRHEDLAALPVSLRDELERAVVSLDREWIARLVSQISEQNDSLGSVLARLAAVFSYTPILRALENCRSRLVEANA
jgi:CheY-like chemotaxis protein